LTTVIVRALARICFYTNIKVTCCTCFRRIHISCSIHYLLTNLIFNAMTDFEIKDGELTGFKGKVAVVTGTNWSNPTITLGLY
jgi:hypothetical protein